MFASRRRSCCDSIIYLFILLCGKAKECCVHSAVRTISHIIQKVQKIGHMFLIEAFNMNTTICSLRLSWFPLTCTLTVL